MVVAPLSWKTKKLHRYWLTVQPAGLGSVLDMSCVMGRLRQSIIGYGMGFELKKLRIESDTMQTLADIVNWVRAQNKPNHQV